MNQYKQAVRRLAQTDDPNANAQGSMGVDQWLGEMDKIGWILQGTPQALGWDNGAVNVYYFFKRVINAGEVPAELPIEATFQAAPLSDERLTAEQVRELMYKSEPAG